MARNTCELHVGRLVELRIAAGYETVTDVDRVRAAMQSCVQLLPGQHVTVVDLRACKVMSRAASEYLLSAMRTSNPRTERSAMLQTANSPTSVMQFLRIVKEAGHPQRRVFTEPHELLAWISDVLNPGELARAHAFLSMSHADTGLRTG